MNRNLESLLRKTRRILATSVLLTMPYSALSKPDLIKIEYKSHTIRKDLNNDSLNEEIYVTTEDTPLPDSSEVKVVVNDTYKIVFEHYDE